MAEWLLDHGADADAKREALEAHATQIAYSRAFMLGFVRRNELFGDFPGPLVDAFLGALADGTELAARATPARRSRTTTRSR